MSDYRDVLERLGDRPGFPDDALERLARRRTSKRRTSRITAGVVALLVATAGTIGVYAIASRPDNRLGGLEDTSVYRHPRDGWAVDRPAGWHLQEYEEPAPRVWPRITIDGALFSNLEHDFRHPETEDGFSTTWDFREAPDSVVLIDVRRTQGSPLPVPPEQDTPLPLRLEDFETGQAAWDSPPPRSMGIAGNGRWLTMTVWIGEGASEADRRAAEDLVASFRFTPEPATANSWPTSELLCNEEGQGSSVVSDPVPGSPGEQMDPIEIARREWSSVLRADDELWRAGDPTDSDNAIVVAVREDRVVARMFLYEGDGGPGYWHLGSYDSCTEFTGF